MAKTTRHDDDTTGSADAVISYLQNHKDFFLHHPELLGELDIPHAEGDGAISLIERQVSVLRDRHKSEQQKLYALVQTARENERVAERLHRIAVEVAAVNDMDDAFDTVTQLIKELFSVQYVSFRITSEIGDRPERVDPRSPAFADLYLRVNRGRSVCENPVEPASKIFLFGEEADVGSAVLIPLGGSRPCGILALGSSRADRFSADHGTFYLDRLGELLGATIRRIVDVR